VVLLAGAAVAFWPKPPAPPPPPVVEAATLSITTRPAGARVSIDGAQVGRTPVEKVSLVSGKRVAVTMELEGYKPVRQDVLGQGALNLDVPLEKIETAPPPAAEVVLKLTSDPPGATVSLGETVLGTTPLEHRMPRSESEATFVFKLAGHRQEKRSVALTADAEVAARLSKPGTTLKPPPPNDLGIKTGR
jgi:hypothetical protein